MDLGTWGLKKIMMKTVEDLKGWETKTKHQKVTVEDLIKRWETKHQNKLNVEEFFMELKPMASRTFSTDIIRVVPMSAPTSNLFHLTYFYDDSI